MTAQRNLSVSTGRLQGNFARLASGLRIATAADDAAGLAISERMRSQIKSYTVAGRNAMDGVSLAQTAEGALNEVSGILNRMRELAVQSASETLASTERAYIQSEYLALEEEVSRIANTVEFNGLALGNGTNTQLDVQVGVNNTTNDVLTNDFGEDFTEPLIDELEALVNDLCD